MTIIKTFDTAETQNGVRLVGIPKKYIVLTIISLVILALIGIWVSNTAVAFGDKYKKLADLEKNLKMENQILENEIAKNSSLSSIASKGAELGFSSTLSIQYIR